MKDLIKNKTIRPFQDFILQNNSVEIILTKKKKISSKVKIKAKKIRVKFKKKTKKLLNDLLICIGFCYILKFVAYN